ncbi:MAG: hypothetical protein CMC38_03895 [Flavobacteriaceae bacterium]|nr:hypothetical protein [Flavobacteriaceae bacterium]|tara:strand:- start:2047 stop:3486 length:1440 start_codon:yes stop_codon:yes gene_type:complete
MGIIKRLTILLILFPLIIYSQDTNKNTSNSFEIDSIIHKVKRKQTLYSISKIYKVSIEEIKSYNPKIKGNKLSRKTELVIPVRRYIKLKPVLVKKKKDSLNYLIPKIRKINLIDSTFNIKNIKIAILAPFKLDDIELDSIENSKKYLKNLNLTSISLDFYSGAIMAFNKIKNYGLNLEVKILDTENDFGSISNILTQYKFEDFDLVLGPLIPRNINQVSRAIIKSKTPIVSPLSSNEIEINENVIQSMPSKLIQRKRMLKYIDSLIDKEPDPCVMIIYDNQNIDIKDQLITRFPYSELINTDESNGFVDPEITDSLLVSSKNNFVFLESENLNVITSVSSLLNSQISQERSISMMTTFRSDIYENENISFEHLGNLNFTYPSYYVPIYDSEKVNLFNDLYLEEFGKRPNKIAIRAYDITLDLMLRLANRSKFVKSIKLGETEYLQNKFNYFTKNNGFINGSIYLIKHEKLNIIKLNDNE